MTCPEKVITLVPRLNFTPDAASAVVLKEEPPFACINCGKPFGTRSTVERVLERLALKHSMFQNERAVRLIQMCEDCRIIVQFDGSQAQPMAAAPRPLPRTTDDYLRERDAARKDEDGKS